MMMAERINIWLADEAAAQATNADGEVSLA